MGEINREFQTKTDWNYLFIALLSAVFFLPFLGNVHLFDWDEINFAECAREMILTNDFLRPQRNFEPFWEKPPLFIWLQALSIKVFGINEFAARLPNALTGIATHLSLYHIGKSLYGKTFGWLWVLSYIGSILPHVYFKSGIIDPVFNLFIFLSLLYWIKGTEKPAAIFSTPLLFSAIFAGLAILTKGPVGFLIISLTILFKKLIFRELNIKLIKQYSVLTFISLLVALTWFGVVTLKDGTWFIKEFIAYNIRLAKTEDAGHGGFFGYHFVVLFFGCFPASIIALRSFFRVYNFYGEKVDFTRWMRVLFWVVLILFSLVQSKIVHYSSMCYLPLTFLSAITLLKIVEDLYLPQLLKMTLIIVGILIASVVACLPYFGRHINQIKPLFKNDIFALKNLDASVYWSGFESLVGILLIISLISLPIVIKRYGQLRGVYFLFIATALFIEGVLIVFVKKIEGYTQNAAIEFYKNKSLEDCYIATYGLKSYAHLYYSQKRLPNNPNHLEESWLLSGKADKPTYVVGRFSNKLELNAKETLQFLYEKNGFVFYKVK
jgi:4-amino-4-deoxy-L-arabinose transferase-like glycosyltransferase